MTIQVLGSGCATCKNLYEMTKKAVDELGTNDTVEYITGADGMQKIIELGVVSSPVLTVNGKVAMVGFVPDMNKIKDKIRTVSHQ